MKMTIPDISAFLNDETDFEEAMKSLEYNQISQFPWGNVDPEPSVRFKIAHNNYAIFVHFDVLENETLARHNNHNDPVHKDSCVEFFIAFDEKPSYYNFEFNCLGTCHAAWGSSRNNRQLLRPSTIDQIQACTKIRRASLKQFSLINWQLSLRFPLNVFAFDKIESLSGQKATANFYKCGDDLSQPHFITWNPVKAISPDFHLKSFFGEIVFL